MSELQNSGAVIVVLGTGGTIAGRAGSPSDHTGYRAGEVAVGQLVHGVAVPAGWQVQAEQLAQLDSKDMDRATWQRLARRVGHHLKRPEVGGVVVTHGTDTLEETAWFLHRTVDASRPVVLTAAMRPVTALSPDGPQNLADALLVAATPGARGVLAVMLGRVHAGSELRKVHGYRIDAFSSGDAGVLGLVEEGRLRMFRAWPEAALHAAAARAHTVEDFPWVEIVTSGAAVRPQAITALVDAGVRGLIVAGTGNGTVHHAWAEVLARAQAQGVAVRRASRCALGGVVGGRVEAGEGSAGGEAPSAGTLSVPQARVELMLELLARAD